MKRAQFLDRYARALASFIYATSVLETDSGCWFFGFDELSSYVDCDEDIANDKVLHKMILNELHKYEGIADIDMNDDGYDIVLYTDYCGVDMDIEDDDRDYDLLTAKRYISYVYENDENNSILEDYGEFTHCYDYMEMNEKQRADYFKNVVLNNDDFIKEIMEEQSFVSDMEIWEEEWEENEDE